MRRVMRVLRGIHELYLRHTYRRWGAVSLTKEEVKTLVELTSRVIYDTGDLKKHVEQTRKEVALDIKKIGQSIIRDSNDWRAFANAVEAKYDIKYL